MASEARYRETDGAEYELVVYGVTGREKPGEPREPERPDRSMFA